ncbi:TetR/AcrR family transcriptional regulator C-terminal domain-containing protein [Microbacterium awajiense]|uniref:TetR/AcrR family transcriptional regulator C-terminal domain-containing protein n=1 Tax=Microbacterium awajiense TaxID=415214 RepID=A0ABP7ANW4_9MICO
MAARARLSRDRIIDAAAAVADRGGLAAVSMRNVAAELDSEAMSLYHHVPNKEALLDGLADWAFLQIDLPDPAKPWRESMTARATSARAVLGSHPWALGMLESRPKPGPALLRHHDRVLGCLSEAGFSAALATHAFSTIDAFVYGFVLTEASLPFAAGEGAEAAFADEVGASADDYPYIAAHRAELLADKTFAFADEFAAGLDLILDAIEAQRRAAP